MIVSIQVVTSKCIFSILKVKNRSRTVLGLGLLQKSVIYDGHDYTDYCTCPLFLPSFWVFFGHFRDDGLKTYKVKVITLYSRSSHRTERQGSVFIYNMRGVRSDD